MFDSITNLTENYKKELKKIPETSGDKKNAPKLVSIFESMVTSRLLDFKARDLRKTLESFYTIGSSGHEGMAVVGQVSRLTDMAFLHYRDAAFMIERSKKAPGTSITYDLLLSFCAKKDDPISGGRHKVLGSKELFIPPQTSTIASHVPKAVGMALSIHKTKRMKVDSTVPKDSVVICTFGDASLNHATAQTGLNLAGWLSYQNIPCPIVFISEDNGIGISVKTPTNWVRVSRETHPTIKFFECDGLNIIDTYKTMEDAFSYARTFKKPVFVRMKTVRLLGHAGSDIENAYLKTKEIQNNEKNDPILKTAKILIENNILTSFAAQNIYDEEKRRIDRVAELVRPLSILQSKEEVMGPLTPTLKKRSVRLSSDQERELAFQSEWKHLETPSSLVKLINYALTDILLQYKEALIFGEDVGIKGGVYHATQNLTKFFGEKRVFNSLLDETNILGNAIGFSHNGLLPIVEIQFLAYIHNALDQIRGEASTLSFFSKGQFTNGMIVRIAGLAYQKGFGGHFHNDNSFAALRDIPGLVIATPSNGYDAALMLRECARLAFEEGRVVLFIEPIALYHTKDLISAGDNLWTDIYPKDLNLKIEAGEFNYTHNSDDFCIVSYANGHYMSVQAGHELKEKYKINPSYIDLRWIHPLNEDGLKEKLSKFKYILFADECRKTGSMSEWFMSFAYENLSPKNKVKRITSDDSFIPLGDAANLVLIQKEDIINATLMLLGIKK